MNHEIVSRLLDEKSRFILYNDNNLNNIQQKSGEYENVQNIPIDNSIKDTPVDKDIPAYWF